MGIFLDRQVDEARRAARAVDEQRRAGRQVGPLAGIPLGIKDLLSTVEGGPTAQSLVLDDS